MYILYFVMYVQYLMMYIQYLVTNIIVLLPIADLIKFSNDNNEIKPLITICK